MLDKFIGDALMAGFGIPISYDDNEDRAVRTAIAMNVELRKWNQGRVARGLDPMGHRIGVNTGVDEETFPNLMHTVGNFNEAVSHYRKGKWNAGIARFKEALKANPGDKLSTIYIERCKYLKKKTPKDWDGIWVMTDK